MNGLHLTIRIINWIIWKYGHLKVLKKRRQGDLKQPADFCHTVIIKSLFCC